MKKLLLLMTVLCLGLAGVASAQLWQNQDVGDGSAVGSTTYDGATGTYVIQADGHDIWDDNDDFHFVYIEMSGDCEISARVVSLANPNNSGQTWCKAGVMVRDTLDTLSVHATMAMTTGNGGAWQGRLALTPTNGNSSGLNGGGNPTPRWVKVKRVGGSFTGYTSDDGITWTEAAGNAEIANPQTFPMTDPVYVGLAVTSHDDGILVTATFDDVMLNGVPFGGEAWGAVGWDPSPLAKNIPVGVYPLSWTGNPPAGQTIRDYKVYLGTSRDAIDPNNPNVEDHLMGGGPVTGPPVDSIALVNDTTYYWRVASYVSDANMMNGVIVSFDTVSYAPMITQQPTDSRYGPLCSAVLTVTAAPKVEGEGGEITYQWYDSAGAISGETADTFTTNVDGDYYVVVSNDAGSVQSDTATVAASVHASPGGGDGKALHERFPDAGNSLAAARALLTLDPATATLTELVSSTLVDPDIDNYRARLTWWLMPTVSGQYQFRIAADDFAALWLSSNSEPANAAEIATIDGWTDVNQWDKYGTQTSEAVELQAGLVYFMRGGYTEGGGGDHIHVQWLVPGGTWADISGGVMNSFLPDQWAARNIAFSPVDGNGWLDYDAENVTFTWDRAEYAPCDAVYKLYIESADAGVPETLAYEGPDLTATIPNGGMLAHDQMWSYRIDVSSAAGAATELGETFSISTIKWVPEIGTNPKDLNVVKAGSDLTLQCVGTALNEDDAAMKKYYWYHVGNPDVLVYTGDPVEDMDMRDGKRYYDCSVTLTPQSTADEGFYYCVVENDNGTATSTSAKVLTERLMVRYEFESLNGKTVSDSSPTGEFDGVLTSPLPSDYAAGVTIVPGVVGNAIDLTGGQDPNSAYVATSASAFDLGIRGANPRSVSVWAKTRDMARSGIYSIGRYNQSMQVFAVHNQNDPGNGFVYQFDHWGSNYDYTNFDAFGTWVHIAHVYNGQNVRIYVDGVTVANYGASLNTASGGEAQPLAVGFFGAYDAGFQHGVFDGQIDDFRLYNYALSPVEVGNLWVLGGGAGGCMEALSQDSNGDCTVDLIDFAALGASWMDSSLITP
jgi:hypothetical protein